VLDLAAGKYPVMNYARDVSMTLAMMRSHGQTIESPL
jgi:hypothetical protein